MTDGQDKEALKKALRAIILAQGNGFIKELLRKHKIPIGTTKAAFSENVSRAIDEGTLTPEMVSEWLAEVDGWGNQHIYIHDVPPIDRALIAKTLVSSELAPFVGKGIGHEFPEALTMSAITLTKNHISMVWHRSKEGWDRTPSKDKRKLEKGDLYEYRAYRQRFERSVVRFEWRLADSYCAIMIQLPNSGDEHAAALEIVETGLWASGLINAPLVRVDLSKAVKAMTLANQATVKSTRMTVEGGHVDLVATASEGGIGEIEAIREVRRAVDDNLFGTADGVFHFEPEKHAKLSRPIRLQGFGRESRLRVQVQCKREDIYELVDFIWAQNA